MTSDYRLVERAPTTIGPALLAALQGIEPLWPRLRAAMVPAPGSLAARDAELREGEYALQLATASLDFGIQHLATWQVLALEARLLIPYPHLTLLRASLEGAVKARWLLEPGVTRDERIARGMGAQIADYEERRKFEDEAGTTFKPPGKAGSERIKDIERAAKSLGLKPAHVPDRVRLFRKFVFGAQPPEKKTGPGAVLYRILSAPGHGMQWAVHMGIQADKIVVAGSTLLKLEFNEELAMIATLAAASATDRALTELEGYTGS